MRFARRHRYDRLLRVELTPMIDVVFLLIIFFMTTAQFARTVREDLELPREQGEQEQTPDESGVVINIRENGGIVVGGEAVGLDELETVIGREVERLRSRDPRELKLTIRADRGGDSAVLNGIVERLRRLGVGAARMATEVPR
jgi:biopolymer transport protein ExbD